MDPWGTKQGYDPQGKIRKTWHNDQIELVSFSINIEWLGKSVKVISTCHFLSTVTATNWLEPDKLLL